MIGVSADSSPSMPHVSGSAESGRPRRVVALLSMSLLAMSAHTAEQEPVPVVWKERELYFSYRSSKAIYSCSALQGRVASILLAVGARSDLEVTVQNCSVSPVAVDVTTSDRTRWGWENRPASVVDRRNERQQVVDVVVRASMPVEMTPDVIAELRADKSRRELISRSTGNPLPRFDDPIPFTAQRGVVTLSRDTIGLEAAECELLDQLAASTFRVLEIRVLQRSYNCDRTQVSHVPPTLKVEAFVPASFSAAKTQPPPVTGDEGNDPGAPTTSDDRPAERPSDATTR